MPRGATTVGTTRSNNPQLPLNDRGAIGDCAVDGQWSAASPQLTGTHRPVRANITQPSRAGERRPCGLWAAALCWQWGSERSSVDFCVSTVLLCCRRCLSAVAPAVASARAPPHMLILRLSPAAAVRRRWSNDAERRHRRIRMHRCPLTHKVEHSCTGRCRDQSRMLLPGLP